MFAMKYKIYFGHSRDGQFDLQEELYSPLQAGLMQYEVIFPHDKWSDIYPEILFPTCSLMIAEISYESTELGIELALASSANIPVLCLHKTSCLPSSFVTKEFFNVISYEGKADMVEKVLHWIEENKKKLKNINLSSSLLTDKPIVLNKKVEQFIAENNFESDPHSTITIDQHRLILDSYIKNADVGFTTQNQLLSAAVTTPLTVETTVGITNIHVHRPIGDFLNILKPCIIYFTGSGFIHSSPQWQTRNCTDLAVATDSIVINIEEKNAPEHKFPEGLNESFSVIKWLFENSQKFGIDTNDISLCGFSSGGNFAAVLARWCAENAMPIQGQYLISPWLDLTCSHSSYEKYSKGYMLDKSLCEWLRDQYVNKSQLTNPDVSPLIFDGSLVGLAPCTIIVAEYEPFHDEAIAYIKKLEQSGVQTRFLCIPGQIHEYAGCYRWSIVESTSEDPILQIGLAIKSDRLLRHNRAFSLETQPVSTLHPITLMNDHTTFYSSLRGVDATGCRNDKKISKIDLYQEKQEREKSEQYSPI